MNLAVPHEHMCETMAPGDWWAYHLDETISASCTGLPWSSFSTLQQVGMARLHVSNEPLQQVRIWTGREIVNLFAPGTSTPRHAFAYRWTVVPAYEIADITRPEDMKLVSFHSLYTGFGYLPDAEGTDGVLLKVTSDARFSTQRFALSEPFPF